MKTKKSNLTKIVEQEQEFEEGSKENTNSYSKFNSQLNSSSKKSINQNKLINVERQKKVIQNNYKEKNKHQSSFKLSISALRNRLIEKYNNDNDKIILWREKHSRNIQNIKINMSDLLNNKPDNINYKSGIRYCNSYNNTSKVIDNMSINEKKYSETKINSNSFTSLNLSNNNNSNNFISKDGISNIYNNYTLQSTSECSIVKDMGKNIMEDKLLKLKKYEKKFSSYKNQFENLYKQVTKIQ